MLTMVIFALGITFLILVDRIAKALEILVDLYRRDMEGR